MLRIEYKNFSKAFGGIVVFDNFNCAFDGGKVNVIMGPSGCGKTTLLNAVAGLLPYDGVIEIGGKPHAGRCAASVSYVFQEPRLIPQKTVFKNLDFALKSAIRDKIERHVAISLTLKEIGLGDAMHKYPHALSGGMAQRVALCRAFLYPTDLLLMDEPFKGLDKDTKQRVTDTFLTLRQRDKRTVLFVTHDAQEAELEGGVLFRLPEKPITGVLA